MNMMYMPYLGHVLFFVVIFFVNLHLTSFSHANQYGKVVKTFHNDLVGSTIDRVEIYPPQDHESSERIVRDGLIVRYGPPATEKEPVANILILHGFMSNSQDVTIFRRLFPRGKYNVMTFNFRAHGPKDRSKGQYCTFGRDEACDAIAAAQFLKHYPPTRNKPLFVYGFSMGAVAAIRAQAQEPLFDAMILDCPFQSSHKIVQRTLDNIKISIFGYSFDLPGKSLLSEYAFHPYVQPVLKSLLKTVSALETRDIDINIFPIESTESAQKITVPCFFIHCKKDEKVSVEEVRTLFESTRGPSIFWLTYGRGHFDSYFNNPEEYTYRVRHFLDDVLDNKLPQHEKKTVIEDRVDIYGIEEMQNS